MVWGMERLISDEQRLVSASRRGHEIPVYDDGFGQLWVHRDSMGISGIVRARTWEDAYEICGDEFFPEADETIDELRKEYGFRREHIKIIRTRDGTERDATPADYPFDSTGCSFVRWEIRETPDPDAWQENELFQEAHGFRPNGPRDKERDPIGHGIYEKDLNGDQLVPLTPELLAALEIELNIENW